MKHLAVMVILLFVALPSFADSIICNTFALQDKPLRLEPLGPGLAPLLAPIVIHGGQRGLVFETSIGPIGSVVFSSTLSVLGLQYTLDPIRIQCLATCGVGYGFLVPMSHKMVWGTLALTLNGATETYHFQYQSSVPEPGSLLLLGTGLVAAAWRRYREQLSPPDQWSGLEPLTQPKSP